MDQDFWNRKSENKITLVKDLTSFILHKHYCENDIEAIIELFDEKFSWFGAGEQEYATGTETVAGILRQFTGRVPKCNLWDEQYDVMEIVPDVYLCTGRLWVATDPSTNMYLRVHQRIATIFRWAHERMYCCHIHISNPYSEMHEEDVGFPTQMGEQSCQYMQESIEKHKKQLEAETRMLERMSFEDLLTGLFNRNKYHQSINHFNEKTVRHIGVACFDLNGLKMMNDSQGHSAGDRLLCCAAEHFKRVFPGKAYRIGGDEFVVMDTELGEEEFHKSVQTLRKNMMKDNISISAGISWRSSECGREKLHQGFT